MVGSSLIKRINALKIKKYRWKYREFVAEGPKLVQELIENNIAVKNILYTKACRQNFEHLPHAIEVEEKFLKQLSHLSSSTYQVLGVFGMKDYEEDVLLNQGSWYLALDDIQDPGNMGTIIRTADWFGIDNILLNNGCVDIYNSKTIQSTMASIARVRCKEVNLVDAIKNTEIPIYGAVLDGKSIYEMKDMRPGIILIGNEGRGISDELQKLLTYRITIPRVGEAESLNAAISAGIIVAWCCAPR